MIKNTEHSGLIARPEPCTNGLGKALLREVTDAIEAQAAEMVANLKAEGYGLKSNVGELGTCYWWVNGTREGEIWGSEKDAWESAKEDFVGTALRLAQECIERMTVMLESLTLDRDALQAQLAAEQERNAQQARILGWVDEAAPTAQQPAQQTQSVEAAQEPVGYLLPTTGNFVHAGTVMAGHAGANWVKLYVTPQQAQPERAPDCRIELVNAIHTLASHYENKCYKFQDDEEVLKAAQGDIEHAMRIAAKWNWNGNSAQQSQSVEAAHGIKQGGQHD